MEIDSDDSRLHLEKVVIVTTDVTCLDASAHIVQCFEHWYFLREKPRLHAARNVVLADISGKGMSGALLMANLQANLRSQYAIGLNDLPQLLRSFLGFMKCFRYLSAKRPFFDRYAPAKMLTSITTVKVVIIFRSFCQTCTKLCSCVQHSSYPTSIDLPFDLANPQAQAEQGHTDN